MGVGLASQQRVGGVAVATPPVPRISGPPIAGTPGPGFSFPSLPKSSSIVSLQNMRKTMPPHWLFLTMVALHGGLSYGAQPAGVVHLLMDDWGYGDVEAFGSTKPLPGAAHAPSETRTPQLEKMAAEGTVLSDFYSSASICSPSRVSWATGRFPASPSIRFHNVSAVCRHKLINHLPLAAHPLEAGTPPCQFVLGQRGLPEH